MPPLDAEEGSWLRRLQRLAYGLRTDRADRAAVRQLHQLELRALVPRVEISRWEKGDNQPDEPQRRKLAATLGGSPADYEWLQLDHEQHDRLTRIKLEANSYLRRLMAGELGD